MVFILRHQQDGMADLVFPVSLPLANCLLDNNCYLKPPCSAENSHCKQSVPSDSLVEYQLNPAIAVMNTSP